MKGKEPVLTREELLRERKKIMSNLVLVMSAAFAVLLALGTMAWFTNNKKVSSEGMQITIVVPEGIQISAGKTVGTVSMNHPEDILEVDSQGRAKAPRNHEENDECDWTEQIMIGNYYVFGRLMPASSISGEHILFTPDAAKEGRHLKATARFFRADGFTDKTLKESETLNKGTDEADGTDPLSATAHAYQAGEQKDAVFWGGTNAYRRSLKWYDTNDDGYYVDVPLWFRTNYKEKVSIKAEGYITGKDDENALYRSVRVAFLKVGEAGDETEVLQAAVSAQESIERNVLPLQDATIFGDTEHSILDSENYTVTRDLSNETEDQKLYGLNAVGSGIIQGETYQEYHAYDGSKVLELDGADPNEDWSDMQKLYVRVWLDGDDKDCWNETAGQDWHIFLRFAEIPGN